MKNQEINVPGWEEETLVQALQKGDEEAYKTFVESYSNKLFRFANGILKNEEDAKDAVQDALLKVFRNIKKYEYGKDGAKFSTWIFTVLRNCCMRFAKKRGRVQANESVVYEDWGRENEPASVPGVSYIPSPEVLFARGEVVGRVDGVMDDLPEGWGEVVELRLVEGMSTKETAEILGVAEGTVNSRLYRARNEIANVLGDEEIGPGYLGEIEDLAA